MHAVPRRRAHRHFIVHKPRNCLSDAIDGIAFLFHSDRGRRLAKRKIKVFQSISQVNNAILLG
jgi:hypothetical protein